MLGHRFKTSHALLNTVSASALQIKQKTEKEGINMKTEREFKKNSRGNVRENVRGNERERHRGGKKNIETQGENESK